MRSFVFYLMVLLMLLWTSVFLMELAYLYYSSETVASFFAGDMMMVDVAQLYDVVRDDFWSLSSAARLAVWALPMLVFAIISAETQPPPQ
jgi:hypothetical protein